MPRGFYVRPYAGNCNYRTAGKRFAVPLCNLAPSREVRIQAPKLRKTKCAGDVRQSIVESESNHLVVPGTGVLTLPGVIGNPVVAKQTQSLGQSIIVRNDHSAFARRDVLHRMKAERGHVRDRSNLAAVILGAKGVAGVLNDR